MPYAWAFFISNLHFQFEENYVGFFISQVKLNALPILLCVGVFQSLG
jgi:hypothetical protein